MSDSSDTEFHSPVEDQRQDNHPHDDYQQLDGFIVSDDETNNQETNPPEEQPDRLRDLVSNTKPNESHTQKVIKAHISVLVSTLGGVEYTGPGQTPVYKIGYDALACLKDIKRWLNMVDEKGRKFDVALACADSGLVVNDLTVMLCQWDDQMSKKEPIKNLRTMEKVMVASLDLLVLLTWPTELTPESSDEQRLAFSNLRKSQLVYKKHILQYNKGQTLKAIMRLVLPAMAKEKQDREPRDVAVLRSVIFFIRNLLYITPLSSSISMKASKDISHIDTMPANVTTEDISMNTVLTCFKRNKVLMFLLTMANSVGHDFDRQLFGFACLECIYLIFKDVNFSQVVNPMKRADAKTSDSRGPDDGILPAQTTSGMQLQDLLKEETKRKKYQTQNISTRHGRFGTLLSIQGDEQNYVVSGQDALATSSLSLDKLDKSKKWDKPKSFHYDSDEYLREQKLYLSTNSLLVLKEFLNQFLAGGCFNNLISENSALLSSADDLSLIDPYERAIYFLMIAWFLGYKRELNQHYKLHPVELENLTEDDDKDDFGSIASALNQTNFILIISYFRSSFEAKKWSSVHVAMNVFLELLLISHQLFVSQPKSPTPENDDDDDEMSQEEKDKELGEGIVRNLFTSLDFLNVLVKVPQSASKHSPAYLKKCVHIVHVLLKAFEAFAKENVKLYIQKKKRKVKSNKSHNDMEARLSDRMGDAIYDSDDEAIEETVKSEKQHRELNLQDTEVKFFHTATVTSYIDFLAEYEDLTHEEIKRCLSYFHRLFVVKKDYTGLFRLDFMYTIHTLRNFLPKSSSIRSHVDEFIVYFMKKFKVAFTRFPMPIEVLFPRIENETFKTYLGTGELVIKHTSQPNLAREIEFIREFSLEEKIKILITALYLQEKEELIAWFIGALDNIIKERLDGVASGLDPQRVMLPTPEKFKRLLINNSYIRHLLKLIQFDLPYTLSDGCELPPSVATAKLSSVLESIKASVKAQPVTFEDGKDAFFFMTKKDPYDDNDYNVNEGYDSDNEAIAFETEGGHNEAKSHYMMELDRLDQLEAQISSSGPLGVARKKKSKNPDATKPKDKSSRRRAREPRGPRVAGKDSQPDAEKPVRSSEFIHDSDDDSDNDDEFFAREERLRRLLQESGGIVNSEQLKEFKRVWLNLANDSTADIDSSVSKAVASANDNLRASQHDDDIDYLATQLFSTQTQTASQSNQDNANDSTRLSFSSDEEDQPSDNDTLTKSDGNKENELPTLGKKRPVISDDEDSDGENISFVSAVENAPRKRRAIIADDDNDD